jgi:hypothetical protein
MVRHSARSGAGRAGQWAASLTPSTPQSFTPSRIELSSGFFDIDAIVTAVDARQQVRSGPTPSMILPIVHRAPAPRGAAAPSLSGVVDVRTRLPSSKVSPRLARRGEAWGLFGFGLAWIATTGAGAVLAATWMTPHTSPPTTVTVVRTEPASAIPVACPPPAYEPPLVAVKDLPSAATPPAVPHAVRVASVQAEPPVHVASAALPIRTLRSDRRGDAASWAGHSQRAAKAAPPRTLEDWMRGAVTSSGRTD